MFKLKTGAIVLALTVTLIFLLRTGGTTEEVAIATDGCRATEESQEQLKTTTSELEQIRRDFQIAKERISILEKSWAPTEPRIADAQRPGFDFQEGHDITREDIDRIRTEKERCAGDRAHLDDVAVRYQTSQTQLYNLQQRLRETEISIAVITRERNDLKTRYNRLRTELNTVLQESDQPYLTRTEKVSEKVSDDWDNQKIQNRQDEQK
ncbi:hypothetical protein CCP3SC1_60047 [Gammaproteobacteria bacterium]